MTAKEALEGSIKKWEQIVEQNGRDLGMKNCPLCELYWGDDSCKGCPVQDYSGMKHCLNTPYEAWMIHHEGKHLSLLAGKSIVCPSCEELAKKELEFLREVLKNYQEESAESQE